MTQDTKSLGGTDPFYTVYRADVLDELLNIYLIFEPLYFHPPTFVPILCYHWFDSKYLSNL